MVIIRVKKGAFSVKSLIKGQILRLSARNSYSDKKTEKLVKGGECMLKFLRAQSVFSAYKNELIGICLVTAALFLGAALFSYNPHDNSLFYFDSSAHGVTNLCGAVGAHISALFFYLFGVSSLLLSFLLLATGLILVLHGSMAQEWDRVCAGGVMVLVCTIVSAWYRIDYKVSVPGGLIGQGLHKLLFGLFGAIGEPLFLHTMFLISLIIMLRFSFIKILRICFTRANIVFIKNKIIMPASRALKVGLYYAATPVRWFVRCAQQLWDGSILPEQTYEVADFERELMQSAQELNIQDPFWQICENQESHKATDTTNQMSSNSAPEHTQLSPALPAIVTKMQATEKGAVYVLPDTGVFVAPAQKNASRAKKDLEDLAHILEEKLTHFGVKGSVVSIKRGPVVTLFEYQPDIDTKISKIVALEDDLALALQALSIRIIAPIPGRSVVGFEVANKERSTVYFADAVNSTECAQFKGHLPLILGQDTVGQSVIVDLATMPHLLMAGSTGSGKSVALNTMLISLLCKLKPEELKLILIDPKRLEFAPYADIPHLLFPIITDSKRATVALRWVVQNMEERYELIAKNCARNITDFNSLMPAHERMPYLVVIIDELADLMMTTGKDVEEYIARITQKARAAGIHMIVATQRPSVDVITGLIKVNFPSRISFRVASKIDSRTILDSPGAEKLLGRGDMLFMDSAAAMRRVHGVYASDKEIQTIVQHIRAQQTPNYLDLTEVSAVYDQAAVNEPDDALFVDVLTYVREVDEVSISLLQRKFKIGFNRSARIIERLEMQGLILPADGSKTRKVIR